MYHGSEIRLKQDLVNMTQKRSAIKSIAPQRLCSTHDYIACSMSPVPTMRGGFFHFNRNTLQNMRAGWCAIFRWKRDCGAGGRLGFLRD